MGPPRGLDELDSLGGILTGIGQVSALLGTYLALVQLVLMGRSPWLDEAFGMDRLAWWHRWLGFTTVWLIAAHGVFIIAGYAVTDGASIVGETITIVGTFPFVLWSVAGFALFVMVGVTSMRYARRRLSYETWFGLHLYAYLAIALAFLHQLFTGADFIHDPVAVFYWTSLYVLTAALVLDVPLRAAGADVVAPPAARVGGSCPRAGRRLDLHRGPRPRPAAVRSGQYFVFRFLTRDGWWRGHPFSLSSAPNGSWLRITVKALGDHTVGLAGVPVGTRVFVEGPYGVLTGARRTRPKVTLIAGGIGIAPLRALLESLPANPGDLTLVYRASHPLDLVFRDELEQLARHRGARVLYVVGHRGGGHDSHADGDPFGREAIRRLVPDIASHDVYLCGPTGMMDAVEGHSGTWACPSATSTPSGSPIDEDAPGTSHRRLRLVPDHPRHHRQRTGASPSCFRSVARSPSASRGSRLSSSSASARRPTPGPSPGPRRSMRAARRQAGTTERATGTTARPARVARPTTSAQVGTRVVDGPVVDTRYGPVQVEVTVDGSTITAITAIQLPGGDRRSEQISNRAEPTLQSEALQAQSANIDGVSGATYTSEAYAQSLQAALDDAGI